MPRLQGSPSQTVSKRDGGRLIEGVADCSACGADYPVRDGIGFFLTPVLPRNDLREEGSQ